MSTYLQKRTPTITVGVFCINSKNNKMLFEKGKKFKNTLDECFKQKPLKQLNPLVYSNFTEE